jgi:excisionase family DNA binding protein
MVAIDFGQQLRTGQVAHRLGISPQRVLQLVEAGRISATMTPFGRIYDVAEVDAFCKSRQKVSA